MQRLTHKRENGIKNGYWSPNKKEELVQCLAEYENLEKTPKELMDCIVSLGKLIINDGWIPVEERLPEDNRYILLSFENFSLPLVGRYEENEEGGAFYIGDCDEEDTCISNDLYVNAWMSLPEPYRPDLCRGCFGAANNDCQICDKGGKV